MWNLPPYKLTFDLTCSVESSHLEHSFLVGSLHILIGHDGTDSLPFLCVLQPLMCINGNLGTKRLGQNQDVTHNSIVRAEARNIFV